MPISRVLYGGGLTAIGARRVPRVGRSDRERLAQRMHHANSGGRAIRAPRLAALARQRLPVWLRCVVDSEDLANSAIGNLIFGLREGQFPDLHDREGLWALLACITVRKAKNEIASASRQKRSPPGARVPLDDDLLARDTPPDLRVMAAERFEVLIERLRLKDELLATIALLKFEGYTNEEIAARLGCSCRRVARKLELIRKTWETEEA
jgi:DNA-directed RNA polymerase specialized sigma24 family protein